MTAYLDPISFTIVGENLNLCLNKALRGNFVLTYQNDDGTPIDLTGLTASLILTINDCKGTDIAETTLFSTGLGNLTLDNLGNITFIVNDATAAAAVTGVYSYRLIVISNTVTQQFASGLFETIPE